MPKAVRQCNHCGKEYECLKVEESRYCSGACQTAAYDQRTLEIRVCAACGNEFQIPHNSPTRTCSAKCAAKSWERLPKETVCSHCGKYFETKGGIGIVNYCSPACRSASRRASGVDNETRFCAACGDAFTVNRFSTTRFCSLTCAWVPRKKVRLDQAEQPRLCSHCGKPLAANGAHVYGKRNYCSNACKSAARRESGRDDEVRRCAHCGKEFSVNRYKPTQVCSRRCSWAVRREQRK
jgi:hypothetical protein